MQRRRTAVARLAARAKRFVWGVRGSMVGVRGEAGAGGEIG